MPWTFDNSFARDLEWLGVPTEPVAVAAPHLLAVNEPLARELGLDPDELTAAAGVAQLAGNGIPAGAQPLAQAYAGHQFGQFNPLLGDGRALLLGEVIDTAGRRRDITLKGSGRTAFSRGGDGRAGVGPVLREYLVGEAMHALGVPTTRGLAAVATGQSIWRSAGTLDGAPARVPGAVLTRVAASHLRVGTAELVARRASAPQQEVFADYVRARHYPQVAPGDWVGLLEAVARGQAVLIARWLALGFVHGVMNTDNMTLSGETIDYGPCAFLEAYDPDAVFSSIDTGGRYRFGHQPRIAQWNLARYAETLLPLAGTGAADELGAVVAAVPGWIEAAHGRLMAAKLGVAAAGTSAGPVTSGGGELPAQTAGLVTDLLALMARERLDFTRTFRVLAMVARGDEAALLALVEDTDRVRAWQQRWLQALRVEATRTGREVSAVAEAMDRVNPAYIPRNHLVEEALAAAVEGDRGPFESVLAAVTDPFVERKGRERLAAPAPAGFTAGYVTFCGT